MNIALEYLNDRKGKVRSVQIPIADWEKILKKVKKYEQTFKLQSDLEEAPDEIALLKKSKDHKQTLTEFLDEMPSRNCYVHYKASTGGSLLQNK